MSIDELCALKVPAAKDSVLYLWATASKLLEAAAVIAAWGYIYKTHAIWDKEKVGMATGSEANTDCSWWRLAVKCHRPRNLTESAA